MKNLELLDSKKWTTTDIEEAYRVLDDLSGSVSVVEVKSDKIKAVSYMGENEGKVSFAVCEPPDSTSLKRLRVLGMPSAFTEPDKDEFINDWLGGSEEFYKEADLIVDPHCFKHEPDDFEDWCGSGLAYRVCKELLKNLGDDVLRARTNAYIRQLAAVGAVCDVVPLVRDNRMIVINGLKSINMMPCKGIAAMLSITGTTYVDETTCGYLIGLCSMRREEWRMKGL